MCHMDSGSYAHVRTMANAHLDFQARTKQNLYVYTPKDDPYLRLEVARALPRGRLSGLHRLVRRARADHVRFTYALP